MDNIVIVVHGINRNETRQDWVNDYQVETMKRYDNTLVVFEHYNAGPFSLWNHIWVNPRQAKSLAIRIKGLAEIYPDANFFGAAHSNGTKILPAAIRRGSGIPFFKSLVLIGSALHSDVKVNGLEAMIDRGEIGKAFCYVGTRDFVGWLQKIPGFYGGLGKIGFTKGRKPNGDRKSFGTIVSGFGLYKFMDTFITRVFDQFSHSEYFDHENIQKTIELINNDLQIKTTE